MEREDIERKGHSRPAGWLSIALYVLNVTLLVLSALRGFSGENPGVFQKREMPVKKWNIVMEIPEESVSKAAVICGTDRVLIWEPEAGL